MCSKQPLDNHPQLFSVEFNFLLKTDNLQHSRLLLCLLSLHGGITLQSDRRLFTLREGCIAKSKKCCYRETPVARNLGLPPAPLLPPGGWWTRIIFQVSSSTMPSFYPGTHIYPCRLPIVNVQLRLQIKGRNTDKKQVWKGEIWHLYFWHERGEWIRLIS